MILEMYSVQDKAVKAFMQPFYCRSRGEAVRSFTEAVNDEKSQFHRHAADYVLFYVGQWNDSAGIAEPCEPTRVISAIEVLVPDDPFPEKLRAS